MRSKNVLTYLSWYIGELNHHGKDEEPCMKMTAICVTISCSRILKTVFSRVERQEGEGDKE